ncbi:MAG: Pyruvoyl-dependent arginine decarboxylase [Methanonatronarchaeales archaeon]|nr:Pyruvoyl-dependent arginine decarboxylase [Methanonatronarchaeales archaeon]
MLGRPGRAFVSSGTGRGEGELAAMDAALLEAGVGDVNLVRVSSVLPPDCEIVKPWPVGDGQLLPCVLASDTGEGWLEAAVAVAVSEGVGMVAEVSGPGAEERAEASAGEMLGNRGLEALEVVSKSAVFEARGAGAAVALLAFGTDLKPQESI